jgi:hypothetical protein
MIWYYIMLMPQFEKIMPIVPALDSPKDENSSYQTWAENNQQFATHVGALFASISPALSCYETTHTWGEPSGDYGERREYVIDGVAAEWWHADPQNVRHHEGVGQHEESLFVNTPDWSHAAGVKYHLSRSKVGTFTLEKGVGAVSQVNSVATFLGASIELRATAENEFDTLEAMYSPYGGGWSTARILNGAPAALAKANESTNPRARQKYIDSIARDEECVLTQDDILRLGKSARLLAEIIAKLKDLSA